MITHFERYNMKDCLHCNTLGICLCISDQEQYRKSCERNPKSCDNYKSSTKCTKYDPKNNIECRYCVNDDAEIFHSCYSTVPQPLEEYDTPEQTEKKLKLYFALFAILKDHEYHASAGYIFAYDENRAIDMLKKRYGEETRVRSIEELKYEEGTVLYGERWHKL